MLPITKRTNEELYVNSVPFNINDNMLITAGDNEEKEGIRLCQENDFMYLLMQTAENPACKRLLRDYCNTGMDTKTVCMYLKLYSYIDQNYSRDLSPYQKICIISNLIKNKETRRFITQKTQEFLQ